MTVQFFTPGLLLKSIVVAIFIRGLGAISVFMLTAIIASKLPVVEAGNFFLAFATVSILFPANLFGTQNASLRFIGADYAEKNWKNIQGTSISTVLIVITFSFCSLGLFWVFSPILIQYVWQKPDMQPIVLNIVLISFLMSISTLIAHHLQAIRRIIASAIVLSIMIPLGTSILVFALDVQTAYDSTRWLVWMAFVNVGFGCGLWLHYSHLVVPKLPNLKFLLKTCLPLWLVTITSAITQWGGQFIAGAWVSSEEIAYLAIAQRTAMLVSFVLISINFVIAPRFAALYKQGKHHELKHLAIWSVRLMVAFAVPAVFILIFFSEAIMSVFGSNYLSASHLLIILSIGQLINVITGSVGYLLTMTGYEKDMRNIIIISSLLTLALSVALCSAYGATGAAIAITIGVSSQNIGAVWLVKKRLGFNMLVIWQKC